MEVNGKYKKKIIDKFSQYEPEEYPSYQDVVLRLELTNQCNHKCIFCPSHDHKRKQGCIEKKFALRILREGFDLGIRKVGLFMMGEPFILNDLHEYIKYAKDLGYTYVFITTNGTLATEDHLKKCFLSGLDSIKFSINGGTRESYYKVHGCDQYDIALSNLRFVHRFRQEYGLSYQIYSGFVVTQYTKDELKLHYNHISKFVDDHVFTIADNYGGNIDRKSPELALEISEYESIKIDQADMIRIPCPLIFNSINITYEGYLTLCCTEADNKLAVEDLNIKKLSEAWYSKRMIHVRQLHMKSKIDKLQCYNCITDSNRDIPPVNPHLYKR